LTGRRSSGLFLTKLISSRQVTTIRSTITTTDMIRNKVRLKIETRGSKNCCVEKLRVKVTSKNVIPAKAGIQNPLISLDSGRSLSRT